MSEFPAAVHHLALTVTNLDLSVPWYRQLFGVEPVLDEDEESGRFHHVAFQLAGGMLFALHTHAATDKNDTFDEMRPGLDHISFGCASRDELEQWKRRLTELGIRHDGIVDRSYGSGLSFRDPDNVALELFVPAP
jgi:glyoxylase I family protein